METRGRSGPLSLGLVYAPALVAVVAMVASRVWHAPILLWNIAWTAGALAAVVATLLVRRQAPPSHRFRWTMWTAACAFWLGGQLAWNFWGAHPPPSPNLGDAGWWGFAVCATIGVMRTPSRSRALRTVALVETVPLIAAALAFTTALLWHDFDHSTLPLASRLAVLVYPGLYVAAAIVTLQALLGGWLRGTDLRASRIILAGIAIEAVTFSFWSEQLLDQTYVQGSNLLDPSFVIGLLTIAAGGVVALRHSDREEALAPTGARGGVLPGLVFVLLSATLVERQIVHAPEIPRVALTCGLLFSGGALMLRSWLLSRRLQGLLERERGAVADLAERESELARINRRLVEDSRHDALTGMRNRRALAYDLPRVESAHRADGEPLAVAVCDIDHFKAYNDRLGHLAGDQALRAISGIVRAQLREQDLGYRFGGEELLLVLPRSRAAEALAAAERVRAAVREAALPHPDGLGGILTVSIGVAAGEAEASVLLAQADAALYEAKRAGRDRVVAASGGTGEPVGHQRRSSDEESVPRQLRSMLALSRAAAAGSGVMPVLQALAEIIRSEGSFGVVVVNVRNTVRDEHRGGARARRRGGARGDARHEQPVVVVRAPPRPRE